MLIVCSSPIYGGALQELMAKYQVDQPSQILLDPTLPIATPNSHSDLALLAPRDWRELGEWIGPLHKKLHAIPWLILADPRVAGLFLPRLNTQPCRVVDPAGMPTDLAAALQARPMDHCQHLPTAFMTLLARSEPFRPSARSPRMPSMVELAISCGVSLGLSNPEIAEALQVSEATVKTHLHRAVKAVRESAGGQR